MSNDTYFLCNPAHPDVLGPFSEEELQALARDGAVTEQFLVTPAGTENWQKLVYLPLWQRIQPQSVFFVDDMVDIGPQKPIPKPDCRKRDYLCLLFGGNALLLLLAWLFLIPNVVTLCFLVAGVVIYNLAILWMMFVLLKD